MIYELAKANGYSITETEHSGIKCLNIENEVTGTEVTVENFGEYSEHPIIVNDIPVSITTNGDGVNLIFSSLTCDTE